MCFDVVFLYENIQTCLFTYVFLHLVLTFTPPPPLHHMVKGLFESVLWVPILFPHCKCILFWLLQ